ncbi:acyloxyacyl hydrolase [Pseudomonas sp. 10-1B]|uniref:acyloxyacyl hydrolase n=1 Tax=Pseudomonas sp. 10-1B TaxID=1546029 RepID=UPI0009E4A5FF
MGCEAAPLSLFQRRHQATQRWGGELQPALPHGALSSPVPASSPAPTGTAQNSGIVRSLWELACRRWAAKQPLCHYSNAGLKQPNDGVESYRLHYRMAL